MMNLRHTAFAAAFIAGSCISACAVAQSLALSYKLDPVNLASTRQAGPVVDRCAGLSWAASLAAACIPQGWRSALQPVMGNVRSASATNDLAAPPRGPAEDGTPAADGAAAAIDLPELGSGGSDASLLRVVSENEPPTGSKSVDVLFRFASKYRLKPTEEGWAVYRFKDVTSENRTQSTGVKGLAVELLFPFQ